MEFREKALDEIIKHLESDFFNVRKTIGFNFLPLQFCEWAYRSNFNVEVSDIKHWEEFEESVLDFDETDFLELMFNNDKYLLLEESFIFISDEFLKLGKAVEFKLRDFEKFVEYYENKFQMSFFQPLDHIIISFKHRKISIIYHEGKLIKIETPDSASM